MNDRKMPDTSPSEKNIKSSNKNSSNSSNNNSSSSSKSIAFAAAAAAAAGLCLWVSHDFVLVDPSDC